MGWERLSPGARQGLRSVFVAGEVPQWIAHTLPRPPRGVLGGMIKRAQDLMAQKVRRGRLSIVVTDCRVALIDLEHVIRVIDAADIVDCRVETVEGGEALPGVGRVIIDRCRRPDEPREWLPPTGANAHFLHPDDSFFIREAIDRVIEPDMLARAVTALAATVPAEARRFVLAGDRPRLREAG